ncbi:MAG: S-methyl-5-thioribose-1-phosphate isomerase [candidate division Zixibacteria bacterium]|nr:S-methyl-5-thioribose-1-phosphate isomerase [candidate division Zixibacteria bacterium]
MPEIQLPFKTIEWKNDCLTLINQRVLPEKVEYLDFYNYRDVIVAIRNLTVRGAPAIGVAAGYALILASQELLSNSPDDYRQKLRKAADEIIDARPTAVNLKWAVDRLMKIVDNSSSSSMTDIHKKILDESIVIDNEDKELCMKIGENGAKLINDKDGILTHCNAGALATAGIGTALGVIYTAAAEGKKFEVFSGETRPLDQGRRLTSWELAASGLHVILLCDDMVGALMSSGSVNKIIVGADRIASNGDTANKIGTFNIALMAFNFEIPFYVAAPYSTFDLNAKNSSDIPIEFRDTGEIANLEDYADIKAKIDIYNPAFDITPHELIKGYITDRGVIEAGDIKGMFENR